MNASEGGWTMAVRRRKRSNQGVSRVGSLLMSSLSREQSMMLLFADLCSRWGEVVGPKLAGRSSPGSIQDGTLTVVVSEPILSQEITMRGGDIASRISRGWGLDVSGVSVKVGRTRRRSPEKRSPKREALKIGPEEVKSCLEKVRPVIPRDDVASDLARLMALYKKRFGSTGGGQIRKTGKER